MGFFDQPHEKIIGWSPPYLQSVLQMLVPHLNATLDGLGAPQTTYKLIRTAVIGRLALSVAAEDSAGFLPRNLKFIQVYTQNADNLILPAFRHFVPTTTAILLSALKKSV